MFSTTLRIDEALGQFLQEAARRNALSVNAFLAELIRREQETAARKRLAHDWRAYAQDAEAQDYAMAAPAQIVAEPKRKAHGARPRTPSKGKGGKPGSTR